MYQLINIRCTRHQSKENQQCLVLDTGRFEVAKEERNIAMCIGLQPCKIAKSRPQKVDTCGVAELK